MARPKADLGSMVVSKTTAAQTPPHQPIAASPPATVAPAPAVTSPSILGPVKALTVKLDALLYTRLLQLAHERRMGTGKRSSHQDIMVEALTGLLEREGK